MTPEELARKLPPVPYVRHGRDLHGLDCFGLVEVWYREVLGIDVLNRGSLSCSSRSFSKGYHEQKDWLEIADPIDHCVVVMRANLKRRVLNYGHCGIFYNGDVLHIEQNVGFRCEKWSSKQIQLKCSSIRIHRQVWLNSQ